MSTTAAVTMASISSAIMGCEDLDSVPAQVLDPLRRLLDAQSAVFIQFRRDATGRPVIGETAYLGPDPQSVSDYSAGLFVEDPILRPLMTRSEDWQGTAAPTLCHLRGTVEQGALETSSYFRKFLRPHQFGDVIAIAIPIEINGPQMVCVGIHRAIGKPAFEAVHAMALDAIARPLKLALRAVCADTALQEQRATLAALTERDAGLDYALFDEHLHVLQSSTGLRAALAPGARGADRLLAAVRNGARALATDRDAGTEAPLLLRLPDGSRGALSLAHARAHTRFVLTRCAAAQADERCGAGDSRLADAAGLTGRERDVAGWIARGLRNAQIAAELGISVRTVENHLRAIYEKLGVQSRAQLVAALLLGRGA